jgi:hypothetical protein
MIYLTRGLTQVQLLFLAPNPSMHHASTYRSRVDVQMREVASLFDPRSNVEKQVSNIDDASGSPCPAFWWCASFRLQTTSKGPRISADVRSCIGCT